MTWFRKIEQDGNWGFASYRWASDLMIEHGGGLEGWYQRVPDEAWSDKFEICFSGVSYCSRNSDGRRISYWADKAGKILKHHWMIKQDDGDGVLSQNRIEKLNITLEVEKHTVFDFKARDDSSGWIPETYSGIPKTTLVELADRALGPNSESLQELSGS